jgi:hypothetical protein
MRTRKTLLDALAAAEARVRAACAAGDADDRLEAIEEMKAASAAVARLGLGRCGYSHDRADLPLDFTPWDWAQRFCEEPPAMLGGSFDRQTAWSCCNDDRHGRAVIADLGDVADVSFDGWLDFDAVLKAAETLGVMGCVHGMCGPDYSPRVKDGKANQLWPQVRIVIFTDRGATIDELKMVRTHVVERLCAAGLEARGGPITGWQPWPWTPMGKGRPLGRTALLRHPVLKVDAVIAASEPCVISVETKGKP